MTNKIKKLFICALLAAALLFVTAAQAIAAFADEGAPEQTETIVNPDISSDEQGIEALVTQFTEYLKDKYGADYEFYYNNIIERWGSVEAYLMSLGEGLPEEYRSDWEKFIGWLGEYSVIWAPALAVAIVILVAVIGKKSFNKLVERIVNSKLSPIVKELNLQSNATVAMLRAQKALLPNQEKYAGNAKELEESERRLNGE